MVEAASKSAHSENSVVIGILPGNDHAAANPYLTYTFATGLGEARNAIIARTADALIEVGGEYGTLSEIALAMKMNKKVILLNRHFYGQYPEVAEQQIPGLRDKSGLRPAFKGRVSLTHSRTA